MIFILTTMMLKMVRKIIWKMEKMRIKDFLGLQTITLQHLIQVLHGLITMQLSFEGSLIIHRVCFTFISILKS